MSAKLLNWRIAAFLIIGSVVGLLVGLQWAKGYKFHEISLDGQKDVLRDLEKRVTLKVNTPSQDGMLGVVGLVLIVDKARTAEGRLVFDRSNVIPTLRPQNEAILVAPTNKTLYEGKVSNTLKAGGAYTEFSGELNSNQTAEILIVDELYMGFRDRTKIPFEQLYKLKPPEGKAYYFVEGAMVTSTTYRTFDEVSSAGTLEAAAFKANGKIYTSSGRFAYTSTLSIETLNVEALRAAEAGITDQNEILSLYRKHVNGALDRKGADKLASLLKAQSKGTTSLSGAELREGSW